VRIAKVNARINSAKDQIIKKIRVEIQTRKDHNLKNIKWGEITVSFPLRVPCWRYQSVDGEEQPVQGDAFVTSSHFLTWELGELRGARELQAAFAADTDIAALRKLLAGERDALRPRNVPKLKKLTWQERFENPYAYSALSLADTLDEFFRETAKVVPVDQELDEYVCDTMNCCVLHVRDCAAQSLSDYRHCCGLRLCDVIATSMNLPKDWCRWRCCAGWVIPYRVATFAHLLILVGFTYILLMWLKPADLPVTEEFACTGFTLPIANWTDSEKYNFDGYRAGLYLTIPCVFSAAQAIELVYWLCLSIAFLMILLNLFKFATVTDEDGFLLKYFQAQYPHLSVPPAPHLWDEKDDKDKNKGDDCDEKAAPTATIVLNHGRPAHCQWLHDQRHRSPNFRRPHRQRGRGSRRRRSKR
jgi:hypothetical protein